MTTKTAQDVLNSFGYLFPEELDALREYTLALPRNPRIINIGAGAGTSGLLFLETRDDSVVTTIDIQDESSPFGCLEGERVVVEQAGLSHLAGTRWFQIHADSKTLTPTGDVDLLFVDGDHSYEGCLGDLMRWAPACKPGGIIAVHDYNKEEDWLRQHPGVEVNDFVRRGLIKPYPGVDQAVDEFLFDNPLTYVHVETVRSLAVFQKLGKKKS